jgi:cytochrome c-type biogenesis protein CcmE
VSHLDRKTAKNLKLVGGILVIILCIGIGFSALSGFVNPYKTVTEITSNPEKYIGRQVQVEGRVIEETIEWVPNVLTFILTDETSQLRVIYKGVVPNTFPIGKEIGKQSRIDVVVIGSLVSPHEFKAEQILVKCPSKYEMKLNETA